ncbi:MAG: porphobilinogen synthase, partial [Spirochaetes bacterium]|nr:porphobilinogen synthase [Spirochaetota bacterium]
MTYRSRRLRSGQIMRGLAAETMPDINKLIMPYFVKEGTGQREEIASMPGIDRVSIDNLLRDIERDMKYGV